MVRLKARYVLFDILYPDEGPHADSKAVLSALRSSLETNFGDLGAGKCQSTLALRHYNPQTSSGVLRIGRDQARIVQGALTCIRQIRDQDVVVRVSHVSGTMKKCEQRAIELRRQELIALKRKHSR